MKINKLIFTILLIGTGFKSFAGLLENEMTNSYIEEITYQTPTPTNLQIAQSLFESILKDRVIKPQDVMAWNGIGFTLKQITEGSYNYAVIGETINNKGGGFYVIKLNGSNSQNILQAPHRPSDLYTHQIIYKLLLEGNYLAAAWNTTKRDNVDFGKETKSFYNAFTIAIAKTFAAPKILQLHAFDATSHEIDGDVILSSTLKTGSSNYDQVATCLKTQLNSVMPFTILQYPNDIRELGGTLNINAKNFYAANSNGMFFHVETSKTFRQQLRDNVSFRTSFSKCFIGS